MSKDKTKTDKVPLKEAVQLTLRGYKIWWDRHPQMLLSGALCEFAAALTPYAGIYISARFINEIAGRRDPRALMQWAVAALVTAAVLALVNAVLSRWRNVHDMGAWFSDNEAFTDKLFAMDFVAADDPHTHHLRSKIEQASIWSGWGLPMLRWTLPKVVRSAATIIGAVALSVTLFTLPVPEGSLAILNHPLAVLAVLALLLFITVAAPALSNKVGEYYASFADDATMGNRYFSFFASFGRERRRGMDARMYRQDVYCESYLGKDNGYHPKTSRWARSARGGMGAYATAAAAVSHVLTAAIYIFVCLKAWGGAFSVGSVTQYIAALTALSGGAAELITQLGRLRNNAAFLRPVFEFLDIPNAMYQGSLTTEKRSDKKYEIEFRDVSFKYPSAEEYALRHVSLKFAVGQRLAVVGQNGSGKTTFIKLLCRLYDPTEGVILLNGIDIRKYQYNEYMDIFSVVFQDFKLLSYSLGQNVAAAADYDAALAADCLQKAGFGERLSAMPKGLETCLYKEFEEDGVDVSGGEAQKIALARALYKDAPFVILDEPTAALDPIAEHEVYSKMNEIVGDKTAVFISHRLSSCRFCADIIVFDGGALVQRGGHDALVEDEAGRYHALWHAQAQYYG